MASDVSTVRPELRIDLGRLAYMTHCKNIGDVIDGKPIVAFEHLAPRVREGWIETAIAILDARARFTKEGFYAR